LPAQRLRGVARLATRSFKIGARAAGLAVVLAVAAAQSAFAVDYQGRIRDLPYLEIWPNVPEVDPILRASCGPPGRIHLRIGSELGVGDGEGGPVHLDLESGAQRATLKGRSVQSPNFQMTAGTELATDLGPDDPVWALLTSGKAMKISGSIAQAASVNIGRSAADLKRFLARCRGNR
jgi:hypothetical protein